ncbi:MAG: HAD hydrolase-like protein [candidate division KSB1 bacterium]|nr:HAD hydrolase-like protein [candidate division KSB1 bacterium]
MNYTQLLENFKPKYEFYIGIDSDGCVFDSMEIKHKECFIPNIIKHWNLQAISRPARQAAEFVNLYSQWRGTNRFPALIKVLELLQEHPDVKKRGLPLPDVTALQTFIESGAPLGVPALEAQYKQTQDPVLKQAVEWSRAVDASIEDMVRGVTCFERVPHVLKRLQNQADIVVVSSTPHEAIVREWNEHRIDVYTSIIAGQEMGNKKTQLQATTQNRYPKAQVLMIGDAPGDMKSAYAVGARFYPIVSGKETESWEYFEKEIVDLFLNRKYTAEIENKRVQEFNDSLPDIPPWV